MGEFAIGQSVPRFEDPRLVRGGGRYVADMTFPRIAYGFVLRSPHAHAKILSIDTSAAKAAPGVLAVLTGADWESSGFGDLPTADRRKRKGGRPMYRPRYPALVKDRVRHAGDHVAFVVAETYHQAADAAELIEVEYESLPAITSTADAAKPGAPLVWDDCENNICFQLSEGNKEAVDAAFAKADHIVKHHFVINRVTAATMEPRACIGDYNAADDHYTCYTTLQRAHTYRSELAEVLLKVPESNVRIVAGDIGGSFGMKSSITPEVGLVLLASKLIGRPVKWVSTRSEAFLSDAQARDNVTDAELALDKKGNFLAMRVNLTANVGAYTQSSSDAFPGNLGTLAGVYKTPALYVEVTAVMTNTHPTRPYRGNGRPEAAYVSERMIDLAADELKMDPVELRRRNTIPPEALPFKTGLTFTYDTGEFEKNMDMALALADTAGFEKRKAESKKRGKLRGLGVAQSIERAAGAGTEGAEIRFDRGGTVTLLSGSVTQGQGHETVFKQLVCDKLGMHPDQVRYIQGDTDKVFFGTGTGGSRTAAICGSAFNQAADRILDKAKKIAAHLFKVDIAEVKFADGIFSNIKTNQTITMKELGQKAAEPENLPKDLDPGLTATSVFQTEVANYPNGCHVCEVEVDPDTGTIQIMRYSVVDDVGTVMNPMLLKGQIVGGVVQGVGQILMEDIHFDAEGQLVSGSFMDYAMPRATDMSNVDVKSNPVPTKTNPLGVKGAGEAGCVGAMPAVSNAIADALSPLGIRHVEMPATPERGWRAIQEAKSAASAA
jgi:aerobic carbon-monoxide dehydrogenase large subunit